MGKRADKPFAQHNADQRSRSRTTRPASVLLAGLFRLLELARLTGRGDLLGELAADDRPRDVVAIRVVELAAAGDQRQGALVGRADDVLDGRIVGVEQLLPLDGVSVDVAVVAGDI